MRHLLIAAALLAATATAYADPQARVVIYNGQTVYNPPAPLPKGTDPNIGLNDPTPVQPVGGNPGLTLGEQRRIALQYAADIWSRSLRSHVEIKILAQFNWRDCNATGAVLASTGVGTLDANFKRADHRDTWYHGALADAISKADLDPGFADIVATFNVDLGKNGCLTGVPFYLGLDGNHGSQVDLVTTALHEFAHGLGFSQFASTSTGKLLSLGGSPPMPDVYNRNLVDISTGMTWDRMTDAERKASAVNFQKVAWIGPSVTAAVPQVLKGTPYLSVNAPASIAGRYLIGTAAFGAPLTDAGVTGLVVAALDEANLAGPTALDACTPLTNAAAVAGHIGIVNRGTCTFTVKAKNLQDAGAIAMIVHDNVAGSPPPDLGGADATITIPAVRVTLADGTKLRDHLSEGVEVTIGLDRAKLAGATADGLMLLYTPTTLTPGSTISHWDTSATPNQLMEPAINGDLTHDVGITLDLFQDEGWQVERSQGIGPAYGHQP